MTCRHPRCDRLVAVIGAGIGAAVALAPRAGLAAESADGVWRGLDRLPAARAHDQRWVRPDHFAPVGLDRARLKGQLEGAGDERALGRAAPAMRISLPMPDGTFAAFDVVESPIMAPALAARFPDIQTFRGRGVDDPAATLRLDITPAGCHAQILSPDGAVYLDPAFRGDDTLYCSYYKRDCRRDDGFVCHVSGAEPRAEGESGAKPADVPDITLRTYRLACAATGEYTAFHGGTNAAGLAAVVSAINRVTGIYETELAIRLELVPNNDLIVFTDPATDPYTNSSPSSLLTQNQTTCDSVIGSANYDIGHVFSTGGGGLASLGVVCVTGAKARGETGLSNPIGDPFYIDYVAHEMGHQFGANHTFNGTGGSCLGNRVSSTAYEPGSGSTIMAYAGICGADDLQPHTDPYFHFISYQEIMSYVSSGAGSTCPVPTTTGNAPPTVDAGPTYTIPQGTPFTLTAVDWNDADGDELTFCWEQRDLGPAQPETGSSSADNGFSPLFRSFSPTADPSRTFPRLSDILNGTETVGEQLPTLDRVMKFRVTARDARQGGGGIGYGDTQIGVVASAGPFRVTAPDTAVDWSGIVDVTWDVAGTDVNPVNATAVDLLLSVDGGYTFPYVLAANTTNDGAQTVALPSLSTPTARVKVQAAQSIFFDVSDVDFSISPADVVFFTSTGTGLLDDTTGNGNSNGRADPGESSLELALELRNSGSIPATGVSALLSSDTPTVTVVQAYSTYADLLPDDTASNQTPFVIEVSEAHSCGDPIELQLTVTADQGGNVADFALPTGAASAPTTLLFEDFESGMADWSVTGLWHLQADSACISPASQSPTYAVAYNNEASCNYDTGGTTAGVLTLLTDVYIPASVVGAQLSWYNHANTEDLAGYDVYSVEISTDGGRAWDRLFEGFSSTQGWIQQTLDLSLYRGEAVRIRFIFNSVDYVNNAYTGWYIDDVAITQTELACDIVTSPPTLIAAVSRRNHVSASYDIPLLLDPPPDGATTEPRYGGPRKIILTFSEEIRAEDGTPDETEVSLSAGDLLGVAIAGDTMTIDLNGVPDETCLVISLSGIEDLTGTSMAGIDQVHLGVLAGDTDNNRMITLADAILAYDRNGQDVSAGDNARYDVDINGILQLADSLLAMDLNLHRVACP